MAISEREYHIKVLENLLSHYKAREKCEGYYDSTLKDDVEALHYAISSLKTDLKYDLLYEGEEIYTKDDMIATLKELQAEIEEVEIFKNVISWELAPKTPTNIKQDCIAIIQQKINAIKEKEDE